MPGDVDLTNFLPMLQVIWRTRDVQYKTKRCPKAKTLLPPGNRQDAPLSRRGKSDAVGVAFRLMSGTIHGGHDSHRHALFVTDHHQRADTLAERGLKAARLFDLVEGECA